MACWLNDPLRAVQALPGVAASDDFRSEFAVRGAGPQLTSFVFDGIATPFMLHTVQLESAMAGRLPWSAAKSWMRCRSAAAPTRSNTASARLRTRVSDARRLPRPGSRARIVWVVDASVAEGWPHRRRSPRFVAGLRVARVIFDLLGLAVLPDRALNFGFGDVQMKVTHELVRISAWSSPERPGASHLELGANEVTNWSDPRDAYNESQRSAVRVALHTNRDDVAGRSGWEWSPTASAIPSRWSSARRWATRDVVSRTEWMGHRPNRQPWGSRNRSALIGCVRQRTTPSGTWVRGARALRRTE